MKFSEQSLPVRLAAGVIIAAGVLALLIWAKNILLPIVVALLLAYAVIALTDSLTRDRIFGMRIPRWLGFVLSAAVIALVMWGIISTVTHHLGLIINRLPFYQAQLIILFDTIGNTFNVDLAAQVTESIARINLADIIARMVGSLAVTSGRIILVVIYTVFIILEFPFIKEKIRYLFRGHRDEKEHTKHVLTRISKATNEYFRIKALASLMTSILCLIILLIFGVDFAFFWALLVFIFNFIPTIGSIIAVAFPAALALVQFASLGRFAIILVLLILAQVLIGNVVEPRIAGQRLDISPLIILIGLVIAGAIWGVIGMIISVPVIIILKIIVSEFPHLRPLSLILARKVHDE